jgi:hypothetical protein
VTAFSDPPGYASDRVLRRGKAQIDQIDPIPCCLPFTKANGVGAGGKGGFQHEVRACFDQRCKPLEDQAPSGEVARWACAGQAARYLVGIDELEGFGPFPQEAVDKGGLPGAVRPARRTSAGMWTLRWAIWI